MGYWAQFSNEEIDDMHGVENEEIDCHYYNYDSEDEDEDEDEEIEEVEICNESLDICWRDFL